MIYIYIACSAMAIYSRNLQDDNPAMESARLRS